MRHLKRTAKWAHRPAPQCHAGQPGLQFDLHKRVTTTLDKAKARPLRAEKMVTLGNAHPSDRRLAVARLHQEDAGQNPLQPDRPRQKERAAGYTRITRLNQRKAMRQRAILEWWICDR